MKKVIFINRYFYPDLSATSQILTDIAFELAEGSFNVFVVCSNQLYQDPSASLLQSEKIHNVNIIRVKSTRFGRKNIFFRTFDYMTFYVSTFILLLNLSDKNDLLIFKTDPPLLSILGLTLSKIKKIKYINWLQDIFPEIAESSFNAKGNLLFSFLKFIRDKSLAAAETNIVIGKNMMNILTARKIQQSKIEIVTNWSDGNLITPIAKKSNIFIRDWNLSGKFIVAYSGNLGRVHEVKTILNCIDALNNFEDIVFLFIGGGNKLDLVKQHAKKHSLSNIHFKPYQDRKDLAQSLSCSDVHIVSLLPKIEGLVVPSKLYGIMASGRPILNIGSVNGEVANTLSEHNCGFTIKPGDHSNLVEKILLLKNNETILKSQGNNARSALMKYYNKSITILSWKNIIKKHFDY